MFAGIGANNHLLNSLGTPRISAPPAHAKAWGRAMDHANNGKGKADTPPPPPSKGGKETPAAVAAKANPAPHAPTTPKSLGEDFQKGIEEALLRGVGLERNEGGGLSGEYFKAQFEVNIQAVRYVAGANGVQAESLSLSMSGSFEFLRMGQGGPNPFGGVKEGEEAGMLDKLNDYFSPEKTAGRILDFALSFFPQSSMFEQGGDTEDARQSFADFIGSAIQKGFDEAGAALGKLPDKVQDGVDNTHDIVFKGLDDFIKNGLQSQKDEPGGMYESIQSFTMEYSMRYESVSVRTNGYNAQGRALPAPKASDPAEGHGWNVVA